MIDNRCIYNIINYLMANVFNLVFLISCVALLVILFRSVCMYATVNINIISAFVYLNNSFVNDEEGWQP